MYDTDGIRQISLHGIVNILGEFEDFISHEGSDREQCYLLISLERLVMSQT